MAAPPMSGKGILHVISKISRTDILDLETFMKWYDEDHIPEILNTSGIRSARRFVNVDPTVDKPYLAMYAMDDIGFTQGDEFRKIRVKSDILPGSGIIYDLADFDVRYDNLIHVYDPTRKGKGATKMMVSFAANLKEGESHDDFDRWYREEHCKSLSRHKSYLRTTRFKIVYARTNAQSRVLKGLAPPTDEPPPTPPTYLTLHEFSCEPEEMDPAELQKLGSSPWSDRIMESLEVTEVNTYRLAEEFGNKDWFHGVEV